MGNLILRGRFGNPGSRNGLGEREDNFLSVKNYYEVTESYVIFLRLEIPILKC